MIMFFGLMAVTRLALAADLPSTCGSDGKTLCEDADGDGNFDNAKEHGDCDPNNELVGYGFAPALGDNVGNNCATKTDDDAADEAAEVAAALAAACGKDNAGENACDSDDPKVSGPAIARRNAFDETYRLCTDSKEGGVWGKKDRAPYTCHKMNLPSNWFTRSGGVATLADRREASARKAGDKALGERIDAQDKILGGHAVAGDKDHPAVAASGLIGDVDDLKARMIGTADKPGLDGRVTDLEKTVNGDGTRENPGVVKQLIQDERLIVEHDVELYGDTKNKKVGLVDKVKSQAERIDAVERTGVAVEGNANVWLIGQAETVTDDGRLLRGAITGGGGGGFTIDSQTAHHLVGIDLAIAPMTGSTAVEGGSVPASAAVLGVHYQWLIGDIAVGVEAVGFADASSNPLDADVSGFGFAAGGKATYYLPTPNQRLRVGLVLHADGGAGLAGTNGQFFPGGVFLGSFGLTVGDGPARH